MTRLAFPFRIGGDGRAATHVYGDAAHVRETLELLILTRIGERVMRPDFGSPVPQMLFGAGNGPAAIALEATLQATITQSMAHLLRLRDLTVDFAEAEAALYVSVSYELVVSKMPDEVTVRGALT